MHFLPWSEPLLCLLPFGDPGSVLPLSLPNSDPRTLFQIPEGSLAFGKFGELLFYFRLQRQNWENLICAYYKDWNKVPAAVLAVQSSGAAVTPPGQPETPVPIGGSGIRAMFTGQTSWVTFRNPPGACSPGNPLLGLQWLLLLFLIVLLACSLMIWRHIQHQHCPVRGASASVACRLTITCGRVYCVWIWAR